MIFIVLVGSSQGLFTSLYLISVFKECHQDPWSQIPQPQALVVGSQGFQSCPQNTGEQIVSFCRFLKYFSIQFITRITEQG